MLAWVNAAAGCSEAQCRTACRVRKALPEEGGGSGVARLPAVHAQPLRHLPVRGRRGAKACAEVRAEACVRGRCATSIDSRLAALVRLAPSSGCSEKSICNRQSS